MTEGLDKIDKELMNLMQNYFPLSRHPYDDIAKRLGLKSNNVISRLKNLTEKGLIRKVGAIIAANKIGFKSILAAVSIPDEFIEEAASIINSYKGVTHNYLREGTPNIWFTLTEQDEETLLANLEEIENKLQSKVIHLPAEKIYKIGVKFDLR